MRLCQALAKSLIGSMESGERKPHGDLEQKSPCLLPAALKKHIRECMTTVCARDGPIAIPWAMADKDCIFAMDVHEHRVNCLHLFPQTQKLRGATLADLEEDRTVKYRTRAGWI